MDTGNTDNDFIPPPFDEQVTTGARSCPASLRRVLAELGRVCAEDVHTDADLGAGLADRVVVLARIHTVIDAELGRSVVAASDTDVLPHSPATLLERRAGWSRQASTRVVTAARFARRHPEVLRLWRCGTVTSEVIAALARGLRQVPWAVELSIVSAVLPELRRLSVAAVKLVVQRALDLLHPEDRDAAEQSDYDRRGVWWTQHGGMTMISADLPDVDGAAVTAALTAWAESLRAEGDGLTIAQRRADALITMVNAAAAHGDLPASASGLPVGATITVGAAEADRVASGQTRPPITDLEQAVRQGADPAALGVSRTQASATTLGDAALRFALCGGLWTGAVIDDRDRQSMPITHVLAHTRTQPLALGRTTRLASRYQRTALALRDGGCLLCQRPPAECQTHHVVAWADGGTTDVDNMVLLCWSHHRQVDLNRWAITRNSDPSPGEPFWVVTPVPRRSWRTGARAAA